MSYLRDVKLQLKNVFITSFERAWRDVVEPALKQSFANGVEEGRKKRSGPEGDVGVPPPLEFTDDEGRRR